MFVIEEGKPILHIAMSVIPLMPLSNMPMAKSNNVSQMGTEAFDLGFSGKYEGFNCTWLAVGLLLKMRMNLDHFNSPLLVSILAYCCVFLHLLMHKSPIQRAHPLPHVQNANRASQLYGLLVIKGGCQALGEQLRATPQLVAQATSIDAAVMAQNKWLDGANGDVIKFVPWCTQRRMYTFVMPLRSTLFSLMNSREKLEATPMTSLLLTSDFSVPWYNSKSDPRDSSVRGCFLNLLKSTR
jgi:hypothetical protein